LLGVFDHPKIGGIGIGIAGAVDYRRGIVHSSPNLPADFRRVPLAKLVRQKLRRPVTVENDAQCFTLAEAKAGAAIGKATVVGLTLGTGVGGGVVINGKILHGRDGLAGHFGHATVVEHGLRCSCGHRGHLESYASGGGLTRFYRQLTGKTIDMFELETRARRGDPAARQAFTYGAEVLALGIANIIVVFNPDVVVLGGGLVRVSQLWRPATSWSKRLLPYPEQLRSTRVVKAKLGDRAGLIGAALAASR
jgi:predicted NBD/HSP70 family sugar kinase